MIPCLVSAYRNVFSTFLSMRSVIQTSLREDGALSHGLKGPRLKIGSLCGGDVSVFIILYMRRDHGRAVSEGRVDIAYLTDEA